MSWITYVNDSGVIVSEDIFTEQMTGALEWFHNTFGKQYEYGKFLDHASPRANANNVSRRIANSIAARRNPALMKNLCDISARHRVVAYVIGRDHIRYDLPVLMEMFSECTIVG